MEPTASSTSDRELVRFVLFGSQRGIARAIHHQHVLGFVDAGAWSKPQPVPNREDEWMVVAAKPMRM